MPSSRRSIHSRSTIKSASDMLEMVSLDRRGSSNIHESRRFIRKAAGADDTTKTEAIETLESPMTALGPISIIPKDLIRLMSETNTYLCGLQATSFQYPICGILDAPWDFYCSSMDGKPSEFIAKFHIVTGSEKVEEIKTVEGDASLHVFRKSVNGSSDPLIMRVFVSSAHPIEFVLDMKSTQQQSFISAVAAVCFWPRLLENRERQKSKVFERNAGLNRFPRCDTRFRNRHVKLLKDDAGFTESVRIYKGLSDTGSIMFPNVAELDDARYAEEQGVIRNIVYAASKRATRHLDNIYGM